MSTTAELPLVHLYVNVSDGLIYEYLASERGEEAALAHWERNKAAFAKRWNPGVKIAPYVQKDGEPSPRGR
jgi:hypothetical protein